MRLSLASLVAACLLPAACVSPPAPAHSGPGESLFGITVSPGDPGGPAASADVAVARQTIETFFGAPFEEPVRVTIAADRAAFDATMPPDWGMTPTQCWMVGVGVADWFAVLSPAAWASEACEHDPDDAMELQDIITHELVHTYHGQHNPTRDFTGMDDLGWFVEGLATYASGQLARRHAGDAQAAIAEGAIPAELESAWSGKYRYGVSGSMVAYIDAVYGRAVLAGLLDATSEDDLLGRLGLSEEEFLSAWQAWASS